MSWMQKLFETYEACSQNSAYTDPPQVEDGSKEAPALMPISHTSQQAHICVTLDAAGNFVRAELMPLKSYFFIPATEESAGRTGKKVAPHPLIDKVHYCASDYKGKKNASFKGAHQEYLALLTNWCESRFSHPMIEAVKKYIIKNSVVTDLIKEKILLLDKDGKLLTEPHGQLGNNIFSYLTANKDTKKYDQGDAFIFWKVIGNYLNNKTWNNPELQKLWIQFYSDRDKVNSLCITSGNISTCATNHPKYIRYAGDGAKLISSNDSSNYTYRGRFLKPEEACTVGYEVSHKIHNALRWLIARQGYHNADMTIVAWAVSGARVPNPCEDLLDLSDEDILCDDPSPETSNSSKNAQPPLNMGVEFAKRLNRAIAGCKVNLKDTDNIAILALDAVSKGRLSVTFYREQFLNQYLDKLQSWQIHFSWPLPIHSAKKTKHKSLWPQLSPHAPTPENIGRVVFGRCSDSGDLTLDKKSRTAIIDRLLPCIVDESPLPWDIVESCIHRALRYEKLKSEDAALVLSVACSVYKGYYSRINIKEYSMTLERTRTSRDYLYGRLLGIARYIERTSLTLSNETRPTNAEKMIQRFSDYPCETWKQLELQLTPYILRLQNSKDVKLLGHAQKYLSETYDLFSPDDFNSPQKLSGEFLLGYHTQLSALYSPAQPSESADNTSNEGA